MLWFMGLVAPENVEFSMGQGSNPCPLNQQEDFQPTGPPGRFGIFRQRALYNIVLSTLHKKNFFLITFFMLRSLLFPYRINLNSMKENRHVRGDTKTLS